MNTADSPAAPDRVLVIDNDPRIQRLLTSVLGVAGFDVDVAGDLPEALDSIARHAPDVIVLDVMLPGTDSFEILQLLRTRAVDVPVLFLTVRGLRLGDDYGTKPFSVVEVGARLQALIPRARSGTPVVHTGPTLRCADLEVNDLRHEVSRAGQPIELSPTEYRLLRYLLSHQGQVLTRAQILEAVWEYNFGGDSVIVERFISNLRRKIDRGRAPLLHTVRGVGYILREQAHG